MTILVEYEQDTVRRSTVADCWKARLGADSARGSSPAEAIGRVLIAARKIHFDGPDSAGRMRYVMEEQT